MTTISQKADYVRQAIAEEAVATRCPATHGHYRCSLPVGHEGKHQPAHTCHWPGCDAAVPPATWGCRKHWYLLPRQLRSAIWRAYRPGQEISKTPSRDYIDVARQVQEWIDANHLKAAK